MAAYVAAVATFYRYKGRTPKAFLYKQGCRREAPRVMDPKSAIKLRQKCANHEGRRHSRGVDTIRRRSQAPFQA
eukprot:2466003-Pleurochrysis_carterae.AAC.1